MSLQAMSGYVIDIVFCVDTTSSMEPQINAIKENILKLPNQFFESMDEEGKTLQQLRIKVISFKDAKNDPVPLKESKFFIMPDELPQLEAFLKRLYLSKAKSGNANALEAIALALKSDWAPAGALLRHEIILFSNNAAYKLGECSNNEFMPGGMAKDLDELHSWWEGISLDSAYRAKGGRLLCFVPNKYPWIDIQTWDRYWPVFRKEDEALERFDMDVMIELAVGDF